MFCLTGSDTSWHRPPQPGVGPAAPRPLLGQLLRQPQTGAVLRWSPEFSGCSTGNDDDDGDDGDNGDNGDDAAADDAKIHLLQTLTKNHSHLGEKLPEGS